MHSSIPFPTIRYIKSLDIHPRKRHGQNFLIDKNIAIKALLLSQITPGDIVIEIGPGLGSLTILLHDQKITTLSYEIDKNLYEILSESLPTTSSVKLFNRDIMKVSFSDIAQISGPLILLGSIPYSLTTPILLKLLDESLSVKSSVFIMQKEVAQRLCALPGTKDYGILTVYCSVYLKVELDFIIPPSCFFPVPKVDSALVRLIPSHHRKWNDPDEDFFRSIVRCSFSSRRKTIFNCLKSFLIKYNLSPEKVYRNAAQHGINLSRRAETFTPNEFFILTSCIKLLFKEH